MIPKFRAWDKIKKMGVVISNNWMTGVANIIIDNKETLRQKQDYILMQSTGLFDKNGVEIFKGDVVTNGWKRQVVTFGTQEIEEDFGSVRIYRGFNLYLGGGYPNAVMSTFEVIGNIYENPELMEVKDD
jgi:uncharacterized phage protein (TIGR01671 family)